MNPEDQPGGSSAVGATAISPLDVLQRDAARRRAVVKGGGQAHEAGGLLGTETNDLFAGASFDLSDSDDTGPPRSSFVGEAGEWFETKFQLRICGHRLGASAAKKIIFALAALLCVFVLVVLVNILSGDDVDAAGALPAIVGASVHAQLTVDVDIEWIAPGTPARTSFELHFKEDVARQLLIAAERVLIESIAAGSVLVTFSVLPDAGAAAVDPTVISRLRRVFGGGQQVEVAGHPVAGLLILDTAPVSQSPSLGGTSAAAAVDCDEGEWWLEAFDDTSWSNQVVGECVASISTVEGFLSTCGNYKNNGCWGAVGRHCPREVARQESSPCTSFSAKFSTILSVDTEADYRFFVSMDDRADIKIDGELVFTSNCEWIGSSCAQHTFLRSRLSPGPHEILVEYVQESDGAYADLKWVQLGQPCGEDEWRVELYSNEDFTSDPASSIPPSCEQMESMSADHRVGRLYRPDTMMASQPWCPTDDGQCDYFSAIYTVTTSVPNVGTWLFDLSSSGTAWLALDDVRLTPSGCANLVADRCETSSYSHRMDGAAAGTGAARGLEAHKISVFFTHVPEDADAYMHLDWVFTEPVDRSCGWEAAIYNAPHLNDYLESLCVPGVEGAFLDTSGLAVGNQVSPCNNGGDCWCPEGLTVLAGDASRCQHWSVTFSRDITLERGGMYRFLSRANLASSEAQVVITIDGEQLTYSGCLLRRGICDQSIFETEDLAAGNHEVVVTLDDSGPAHVELQWQQIHHGCEPNQWRVEGMAGVRMDSDESDDEIVSVKCVTYNSETGFLELPDDFCPQRAADETCAVDANHFRAAFTTTANFMEAGIYRFSQRFRDTGVVSIDGVRMQPSGCQNAFGSRCTETTFDLVLTRGNHVISVDLEFEDPQNSKKVLGQLQWLNLGTGDCEWQHGDWHSGNWYGSEVRRSGLRWGGSPIDRLGDDDYFTQNLPWSFPFYGAMKQSVRINANGYITFSGDHHGYGNTAPIPDPDAPNDMIAVYWTDLNPNSDMCGDDVDCGIYTYHPLDNPDAFVIQWHEIPFYEMEDGSPVEHCTFSCILHRNGTIEMTYRHVPTPQHAAPHSDYAPVSIGIEGPSGSAGLQISYGSLTYPDDRVSLVIPQSCNIEQCGRNEWFMELFSDTDFSTPVATTCEFFNADGHLLTCPDYRNGGCWCPASLTTYDTHLNYVVTVGPRSTNDVTVTVPGAEMGLNVIECGRGPVNYQSQDWSDTFTATPVGSGRVRVRRTDQDGGWGQNLQLLCTVEYTTADTPVAGECRHFSAILTAPRVKFDEAGLYRFHESSHDEAVVYVDGERVHSAGCDWVGSHCAESEIDVQLTAGIHSLQYSFVAYTGRAYAYLAWEHIENNCPAGEWRQELFDNTDFTSPSSPDCDDDACRHSHQPVDVSCQRFTDSEGQYVPFIQTCPRRTGCWCPAGLTLVDGEDHCHHFSARLISVVNITSGGLYRFHVQADDEAEVFINGELHQSLQCGYGAGSGGACREYVFETTLSPGEHSVMFEFVKYEGMADASLTWERVEGFQCAQRETSGDGSSSASLPIGDDKSVIFQLQAAGEAHLIFKASSPQRVGEYHIVLGASSNQAVSISKNNMYNQKATAQTPGILHSYESLPFWASASDGLVRVGMGNTLGMGTLLEWQDANPLDVTEVTVATELQYRGSWHLCASAACRAGEWRQELFANADFSEETGVSCVNYDATNSGFLNTCGIVQDSSDQLLSHVDLVLRSREDSAEECEATNQVFLTSSDLELLWDRDQDSGGRCSGRQQVALRFRGADILPETNGLHVRSAVLTLTVDEFRDDSSRDDLTVTVEAEASDDSAPFGDEIGMITSRPRTTASVQWSLHSNAQIGEHLVSPNLAPIIQEILNRDGWHYGNALTLIISEGSGTGNRWVSADSAVLAIDVAESAIRRAPPGCWRPGGERLDVFSAILNTVVQVDESSRYRFFVDNDDTAAVSISVDGRELHSSGCESVNGNCGNRIFDATLDYGRHEISVRFAEHEGQAHLSLSWETVFFDVESMRECYTNFDASDYRGRQAITANGYGCADWASQDPHPHPDYNTAESSPEAGLLDNYCRNPNGRSTAWCYTTDPDVVWDLCLDIGPPSDSCDVCSSDEWFMEVFDNADFTGLIASECFDAGAFLHVSPFCPDVLEGRCDYVSATFTRTIQVGECSNPFRVCHPGGMYRFFETSGHDSKVFVDGDLIHESVCDTGRCSTHNFEIELSAGTHTIMYDLQGYDGVAYVDLHWEHIGDSQCRYRRVASEWVEIATIGTEIPPLEDDDAHTLELPFDFPYYGGVKEWIKVSSNGYLTFSGDHFSYGDTSAVPSTQVPNDFIAPYWTDLNPESGGEIYYYHYSHVRAGREYHGDVSAENSRSKFIVQWNNIPYYCTEGDCPTVTFQVLLYPSGAIKFQYLRMEPNPNIHGRPVVGIENGEGDAGIMMSQPPQGALNDPNFVGAEAFGGSSARMAYYLPRPCEVRDCAAGSWRVEVFRGDDFTLPVSASCRNFESHGFLATSLACGGWMTASLGWHRIIEPCWCPAALETYAAGRPVVDGRRRIQVGDEDSSDQNCPYTDDGECDEGSYCPVGTDTADCCDASGHVRLDSTGQPVSDSAACPITEVVNVEPVVDVISSSLTGIDGYTTYRLSLALTERAGSVYTIFGREDNEMTMPPAFQVGLPWGANIGGVNPIFWTIDGHADGEWDSWLTVTDISGTQQTTQTISQIGVDFSSWDETSGLRVSDGAVFWMDPGAAPVVDSAVVAQVTIRQGAELSVQLNAQGRGPGGAMGNDWQQFGIEFSSAGPAVPGEAAEGTALTPAGDPCEYFSAIFTTTLSAAQSGRYTIFETSHFSSSVFVDGNQLASLGCVYRDGQCAENMFSVFLQEGDHEIVVKFVETVGGAFSHVWWQYVGSDCDYSHGNFTDAEWQPIDTYTPQPCNRDGTTQIASGSACAYQGLADDDYVIAHLPDGWNFPFYGGHKRGDVRISTNGYLTFSGAHFSYGDTVSIPDAAVPNDLIAPYWTDLNPVDAGAEGGIFTYATESQFVVLWKKLPLWGTDAVVTFQVILTSDGAISFLYQELPFQMLDYAQPSVGLENSDGTQGLRISYADVLLPAAGMKISIPESCEHPPAENGPSQGARACDDTWSMEVYAGTEFMHADGSSALVSSTCLTPPPSPGAEPPSPAVGQPACSASDFSHSDPSTGFITDDSQCSSANLACPWQGDGVCDSPSICPDGTDSVDCGDTPSAGCWCPAALNDYNDPTTPGDWWPDRPCSCTTFGVIYSRTLWIQTAGLYRFTESSPDEIAIFIDGEHLHRSGCVPGSKTEATHLNGATYTMTCTDESTFDVELTAAQHMLVVSLVHHSSSTTAPPTLEWEFLGSAPCEWSSVPYEWIDEVRDTGQQILGDGVSQPADHGVTQQFPDLWNGGFPFFGGQMHEIHVFVDGFMTFQTNEPIGDGSTQAFPSPVEPNNIIAPWWVDLDVGAGSGVFVHAPADASYWAVEWHDLPYFGSGHTVDFQAILREDGTMTFSYKKLPSSPAAHHWAAPSIGLENVAGTDGLRIAYDPDPSQVLAPGVPGKPAEQSSITIPSACATAQCGVYQWVVAAYSDLAFSDALHTTCEDWGLRGTDQEGMLDTVNYCPVAPDESGGCPQYSAYFIQNVRFERSGIYRFTETSPNTVGILFINDQQVLASRMEPRPHIVNVRIAAGTYELMYGVLHPPIVDPMQDPSVSLSWTLRGQSTCAWSSSDDDDDGTDGGADGVGGGAVPFEWVDLSRDGHCEVGSACPCDARSATGCLEIADDGYIEVALPTEIFGDGFPFYGGRKTVARVSANGYLTFSGEHLTYGDTQAIPDTSVPNDMIAVYWTDLDPSERGSIYTLADSENSRWIVEWHEIPLWDQPGGSGSSPAATFQAMLYASGEIRLQYLTTPRSSREGDDVRSSPAVGIENVDGSEGEQIAWNQATFPAARTAITIPSECEIGNGSGECGEGEWEVQVYHDLHFQMRVYSKCEHYHEDGHLQTCPDASASCWCPAGLARYGTGTYEYQSADNNQTDPCPFANDNECDVDSGLCRPGTDINDCSGNADCTGNSDGFSAIFSSTIQIEGDAHGNYVFGALFGAMSATTVIIDDDIAFIWDSRLELSSQCTGTRCSDADRECSCSATPAFVASGLEEDCPDGCVFTSSSPATLQTFDHYLTEGRHSITVEYVEEAGANSGGNALLSWVRA